MNQSVNNSVIPNIIKLRTWIVNVYFVVVENEEKTEWILVDAGLPFSAGMIKRTAQKMFGENTKPLGIILTHGHFDHIGALQSLIEEWDVPIFAHSLEIPFLTGKKDYLPPDWSVGGGMMTWISPLYPYRAIDLGNRVRPMPDDGRIPFLKEWKWIHTPGHTPGHISLFRENDRVLIVGDAFITVKQESLFAVLTQRKEIHGPPMYFTPEWQQAKESVVKLRNLEPSAAFTGHGLPMYGEQLSKNLEMLIERFDQLAIPKQGRYVHQ
jgi:glyoxylase-like metal-dependent hydrolase (beta-lactamase superfamily II)